MFTPTPGLPSASFSQQKTELQCLECGSVNFREAAAGKVCMQCHALFEGYVNQTLNFGVEAYEGKVEVEELEEVTYSTAQLYGMMIRAQMRHLFEETTTLVDFEKAHEVVEKTWVRFLGVGGLFFVREETILYIRSVEVTLWMTALLSRFLGLGFGPEEIYHMAFDKKKEFPAHKPLRWLAEKVAPRGIRLDNRRLKGLIPPEAKNCGLVNQSSSELYSIAFVTPKNIFEGMETLSGILNVELPNPSIESLSYPSRRIFHPLPDFYNSIARKAARINMSSATVSAALAFFLLRLAKVNSQYLSNVTSFLTENTRIKKVPPPAGPLFRLGKRQVVMSSFFTQFAEEEIFAEKHDAVLIPEKIPQNLCFENYEFDEENLTVDVCPQNVHPYLRPVNIWLLSAFCGQLNNVSNYDVIRCCDILEESLKIRFDPKIPRFSLNQFRQYSKNRVLVEPRNKRYKNTSPKRKKKHRRNSESDSDFDSNSDSEGFPKFSPISRNRAALNFGEGEGEGEREGEGESESFSFGI